jgi:D-alanyl-D-alanine dipeptidase
MSALRIEDIAAQPSFRRLDAIAGIAVDLRYAGSNNFAGRALYRGIDCAWLRVEAALGLETAAAWLAAHHPGRRLLVLDALRPQRVQEAIWRDMQGTPGEHYFADPARGSIHSFGMAVDVTLLDEQGRELDMGSGFDEMSVRSHPALEAEQLATGSIRHEHVEAREMLREAMRAGGFAGIPIEWWHFNHGDVTLVRRQFARVE